MGGICSVNDLKLQTPFGSCDLHACRSSCFSKEAQEEKIQMLIDQISKVVIPLVLKHIEEKQTQTQTEQLIKQEENKQNETIIDAISRNHDHMLP